MSDEEIVKQKYPLAYVEFRKGDKSVGSSATSTGYWVVWPSRQLGAQPLGTGMPSSAAWKDAATKIQDENVNPDDETPKNSL